MTAQTHPRCKTSKPEEESTRKQRQKGEDEKSKSTRISSEKKVGDGLRFEIFEIKKCKFFDVFRRAQLKGKLCKIFMPYP